MSEPGANVRENDAAPAALAAAPDGRREKPWKILIVDDNSDIVVVIRRILSVHGYDTLVASDGKEALQVAREKKPDLLLLDWMLPEVDGLEVCRELKGDPETRGIMVLLVTGRGSVANRVEGLGAGADDYIRKPFNHPELLARIRSALRVKRLTDNLEERNRQLIESQNELVRTEKMATIGLLASGIAHEFNNIMAGISGYAQLATANPKYLPQLVEVALTQTERAMELTRSLATYHRSSSVDQATCDVPSVVSSALCLVKKELEEKGILLKSELEEGVPRAAIQPGQLQEVVLNMIINAIHAIREEGSITLRVRSAASPEHMVLEVSDSGEGIAEENLQRIFDPFFTTKGPLGGGKQQGTGLGLSVSYNIVRARGGNIDVESEIGKGTTFTITLPVHQGDDSGENAPSSEACASPERGQRLRILVVDDEGLIRRMLLEFLRDHEVVCCADGETALRSAKDGRFDYALLDICLENSLNGFKIMKQLKRLDPAVKVILASGRLPEDIDRGVLEEAHGHLLKPYKFEDLAALLGLTVPA
ncbi:MAG: response regulator [Planctomycetota bacterium]|nr:response regulator [Planctomycetota bacterium]